MHFIPSPPTALAFLLTLSAASAAWGQATVAALNQNRLWAGIENPVNITSVAPFDDVRITGGEALRLEFKGDRHASLAIVPDPAVETVSVAMRLGEATATSAAVFRVEELPQPIVRFGRAEPGDSLTADALASADLTARVPEVDEDLALIWHGFTLSTMIDGVLEHYASESDQLTSAMRTALEEAPRGTSLFFNRLAIETPDGKRHEAPNILLFKK
jgi:hypothetical protein